MSLEIEHQVVMSMAEDKMAVISKFDRMSLMNDQMVIAVMREIACKVADRYVAENFQEIIKNISPEAIANLTVAECGARIRETLEKKIPDKVLEIERTRTEVYQRGIFGGVKRVL